MDIIHTLTVLEDQFSGAITRKITTQSKLTFDKMVEGIGTTFSHFDKVSQIRSDYKVVDVRQAQPEDYKNQS